MAVVMSRDGFAQRHGAARRRILVGAFDHGFCSRFENLGRPPEIGEALTKVHGVVLGGKR